MVKHPVILDCDNTFGLPGCDVDDGLALLYLLGSPEICLLGITCSYGNNTQERVYANTRRLLRQWGREDISVLCGANSPEDRRSEAAEFLAHAAQKHKDKLLVIATGAMTNLLGATEYGSFFENCAGFSLMGGITEPLFVGGQPCLLYTSRCV